jgi:hypothetical protein
MTTFNPADLPSTITSLERLCVWANTVLRHLNRTTTYLEETNRVEYNAQSSIIEVSPADSPVKPYHFTRTAIPLGEDYLLGKAWEYAEELSSNPIPTQFKS